MTLFHIRAKHLLDWNSPGSNKNDPSFMGYKSCLKHSISIKVQLAPHQDQKPQHQSPCVSQECTELAVDRFTYVRRSL